MGVLVVMGAELACTFGAGPSNLVVVPEGEPVTATEMPVATIADFVPLTNIMPFAMCVTPTNPAVAAATSAALGVLTPVPCVPVVTSPWTPGVPTVLVNGQPALDNTSTCSCMWGGVIAISNPGQTSTISSA